MPSQNTLLWYIIVAASGGGVALLVWAAKEYFTGILRGIGMETSSRLLHRPKAMGVGDVRRYRASVDKWDRPVPLGLRGEPVPIDDLYVPLHLDVRGRRIDALSELRNVERAVLVGAAGAGKSMLLLRWLTEWSEHPERFARIPILVSLYHTNDGKDVEQLAFEMLRRRQVKRTEGDYRAALEEGQFTLLLDGLDEVVEPRRPAVMNQIVAIAQTYPKTQIVVTCRDAVYENDLVATLPYFARLASFSDADMRRFFRLWLLQSGGPGVDRDKIDERVERLMGELRDTPAILALAGVPLLLSILATLESVDPGEGHVIPASPADFYRDVIGHMLSRDNVTGRTGTARFKYAHKAAVLRRIALAAQSGTLHVNSVDAIDEDDIINDIIAPMAEAFNLERRWAQPMLDEIVQRSELLIRIDRDRPQYTFRHVTLKHYLAAVELADRQDDLLAFYQADPTRWSDTVRLWCGAANRDCTDLIRALFGNLNGDAGRVLAFECLGEAKQVSPAVAGEVVDYAAGLLGVKHELRPAVVKAFGSVAASRGPRGNAVLEQLRFLAESESGDRRVSAIQALASSRLADAVEILRRMSQSNADARAALRSMGDQAVAALSSQAQGGWLGAIDDLGEIGTPLAAEALADLIWLPDKAATRAAWHLAALLRSPDVAETLARHGPAARPLGARALPWVWEPFRSGESPGLGTLVDRVCQLISESSLDLIPSAITELDNRITLALGVVVAATEFNGSYRPATDPEIQQMMRSALPDSSPELSHGRLAELLYAAHVAPSRFQPIGERILSSGGVKPIARKIFGMLPLRVWARAIALFAGGKPDISVADWRHVCQTDGSARLADKVWSRTAGIILSAVVVVGIARAATTLAGVWVWGTAWLSWLALLSLPLVGMVAGLARVAKRGGRAYRFANAVINRPKSTTWMLAPALGATIVLGSATVAQWTNSAVSAGILAVGFGAAVIAHIRSRRRLRESNPMRSLLLFASGELQIDHSQDEQSVGAWSPER